MNYFLYKHLIDKKQEIDPVVLMRYCEHCGSKIWGIWELPNLKLEYGWGYPSHIAKDCLYCGTDKILEDIFAHYSTVDVGTKRDSKGNLKSYNKTIIPSGQKSEYDECKKIIKSLKSSKIDEHHNQLISFLESNTCPICGNKFKNTHNYNFETIVYPHFSKLEEQYGFKSIWYEHSYNEKELGNINFENIESGEKIKTKCGVGRYVGRNNDGKHKIAYYQADNYESIIEFVEETHKYICSENCIDRYNKITNIDTELSPCSSNIQVKITQESLKEYLLNVINIEKNIYCLCDRLKELYVQEKLYEIEKNAVLLHNVYKLKIKGIALKEECEAQIAAASKINVTARNFPFEKPKKPQCPDKPKIEEPIQPILQTPGFFNKKKIQAENEAALQDYQNQLDKYNEILQSYNNACGEYEIKLKEYNLEIENLKKEQEKRIQEETKKIKKDNEEKCKVISENYEKQISELKANISQVKKSLTPEALVLEEIKAEIENAEKLLTEALKTREKLYSYNIIFEKYRDFVAVSSFYEYLLSGRCTTLDGADGAYNLYENEIRMNLVISQLSRVINLLEEIRNNQYTIYNAINEVKNEIGALNSRLVDINTSLGEIHNKQIDSNLILSSINENTEKIRESAENIAYNTAATAFYTKRNTEITAAIGFMVALK